MKRKQPGRAGRHSLVNFFFFNDFFFVNDAQKFAEELGMELKLQHLVTLGKARNEWEMAA